MDQDMYKQEVTWKRLSRAQLEMKEFFIKSSSRAEAGWVYSGYWAFWGNLDGSDRLENDSDRRSPQKLPWPHPRAALWLVHGPARASASRETEKS